MCIKVCAEILKMCAIKDTQYILGIDEVYNTNVYILPVVQLGGVTQLT